MSECNPTGPFLNIQDVAALLKISPKTVEVWRKKGMLPKALKLGRLVRWRRADIEGLRPQ